MRAIERDMEAALEPGRYFHWRASSRLVREPESILVQIEQIEKAGQRQDALELYETFVAACYAKANEIDDSIGIFGGFFDVDRDRYIRIIGELRSQRRPLFHQLDLRLEKTWTFQRWRLVAYLDVQNVYNAENPEATIYDFRYERSAQLPGLPILPSLGLRGSF